MVLPLSLNLHESPNLWEQLFGQRQALSASGATAPTPMAAATMIEMIAKNFIARTKFRNCVSNVVDGRRTEHLRGLYTIWSAYNLLMVCPFHFGIRNPLCGTALASQLSSSIINISVIALEQFRVRRRPQLGLNRGDRWVNKHYQNISSTEFSCGWISVSISWPRFAWGPAFYTNYISNQ